MPIFSYKVRKSTGEIYENSREAADKFSLYRELKKDGDSIISVNEVKNHDLLSSFKGFSFRRGISMHDKILFARNISAMLQAGLSLTRALSVLERQTRSKKLQNTIHALGESISRGQSLSESMKAFPDIFSSLFTSMVHAGEEGGNLAESLRMIASQLDKTYAIQRKVKGALIYPAVIICIMIIIGILMMIYVVPTLSATFKDVGGDLPLSTQFVIGASNAFRNHGIVVFGGMGLVIALFVAALKTRLGKRAKDFVSLRIPVVGSIIKQTNAARTTRTLSSLLTSGVAVTTAMEITGEVMQNSYYKEILSRAKDTVEKGKPIAGVFAEETRFYPVFVSEMIAVGEETGQLPHMLLEVAEYYEAEVEEQTKDMSTIVEPFLMVLIGAAVGFFAIAMISPMYSLVNNI